MIFFLNNGAKIIGYSQDKKKKISFIPYLAQCIKINSKWIRALNVKPKITKFLEKKEDINVCHLRLGKEFLNMAPKVQSI